MTGHQFNRRAFTSLELLVVVAIISLLIGLLLPAVQAAREAARRMTCQNDLLQMGLALHQYNDVMMRFPPAYFRDTKGLWSGSLLPFIEQSPLFQSVDFSGPWGVPGSQHAFALTQIVPMYRCPSASIPEHFDHVLSGRVPGTYLACGSGTAMSESNPLDNIGVGPQNGIMFADSRIGFRDLFDGTTSTIAIGESLFDTNVSGPDFEGDPQIVDHWYFASPSISTKESSETMGSTGPAINSIFSKDPAMPIEQQELCFSSNHSDGAQVLFCDGHVALLSASIDRGLYSSLGTRNGRETGHAE